MPNSVLNFAILDSSMLAKLATLLSEKPWFFKRFKFSLFILILFEIIPSSNLIISNIWFTNHLSHFVNLQISSTSTPSLIAWAILKILSGELLLNQYFKIEISLLIL